MIFPPFFDISKRGSFRAYTRGYRDSLGLLDLVGSLGSLDVQQNSADDDQASEEGLPGSLQAASGQASLQDGHDEHADQGADHGAGATGHGSAADNDGGNAVHFTAVAGAGSDGGVSGSVQQARHTNKEARQSIHRNLPVVNIDTGQTGSFFVGADGIGVAAELGLVQDQGGDDKEADQPESADGEALDAEQLSTDEDLLEPAADFGSGGGPGLGLDLGDDGTELSLFL